MSKRNLFGLVLGLTAVFVVLADTSRIAIAQNAPQPQNPQSQSTGLQGKISSPPPSTAATINAPRDGQSFTTTPVTVSGSCTTGLLIKLFKNNVFAGSVQCANGSYSLITDLFNGRNELIVRVYDALDQAGPDSSTVNVSYTTSVGAPVSRVTLTSNYAKRGANPNEVLTWPIIIAGGTGPYAVSVDWGDGSAADIKSQEFPGTFDIKHSYTNPGVYNIIVKATDKNNIVAYLQLVGVANGALSQDTAGSGSSGAKSSSDAANNTQAANKTRILWEPAALSIPLILMTFWLGMKHQIKVLRRKIEQGQRPF